VLALSDVEALYQTTAIGQGGQSHPDEPPAVLLTFDDGWKGCLDVATEPLREFGMQGLMFVTTGLVGSDHFCTWDDLRKRDRNVWRIGSHSASHGFLNEQSIYAIHQELRDSKRRLEDEIDECVTALSIPNGAVSDYVRAVAEDVGYSLVFTSDVRINSRRVSRSNLGRLAVHTPTNAADLERWLFGHIRSDFLKRSVLRVARCLLGPQRYRVLRSRWLGEREQQLPMSRLQSYGEGTRDRSLKSGATT
jgi:peptidoglycan/xylan/chitin deacetylase (PgdA/CDA1 family)